MIYYPEVKIAASILAADYSKLGIEIRDVEESGADLIHVDVMDGNFVPNITIGPDMVRNIRKTTTLPLDVHLMISNPELYAPMFIKAGADIITFHVEVFIKNNKLNTKKIVQAYQKTGGIRTGLVINPNTQVGCFKDILKNIELDFILLMSVNPGFGGQSFIPEVLEKAKYLREIYSFKGDIEIDGGINDKTSKLAINAGCNILVAGTYIFNSNNRSKVINSLKNR